MLHRRITRSLALGLAVAGLAAPTAMAVPDYPQSTPGAAPAASPAAPEPVRVAGPSVVVEADEASGFDWGSAAIGAGVAAAMVLLATGAALTVVRHGHAPGRVH
jgi:hypothetical protein